MAKKKQETPLSADAIAALRGSSFEGNSFALPEGHLDCYAEVKALMTAIGGKWVSGKKRMVFSAGVDCETLVLAACDRGNIPPSNPLDFFPTPPDVVEEVVTHPWLVDRWEARITVAGDGPMRYLEPNGGSGAFVAPMAAKMRPQDELVICEMNPLMADMLRTRFPQATVVEGDFLAYADAKPFDVILMNPPFDGQTYRKHVLHAESMLARLGVLVSVVPSSFKDHCLDFLYRVASKGEWHDFGGDRFADTKTETTAVFIENDPEGDWREKPCEGFKTHHAWDAAMSIANDGDVRRRLADAEDFQQAFGIIKGWADEMLRSGTATRMNEAIARDTIAGIVQDYDAPEFAHLLGAAPEIEAEQLEEQPTAVEPNEIAAEGDQPATVQGELALV